METRSHEQRKGLLALVTGLSALSLIFTGLAPAYALDGTPATDFSGKAGSVARIEVPRTGQASDGSKYFFVDSCTGVLLDDRTVLTVQKCAPDTSSPYEVINSGRNNKPFGEIFATSSIDGGQWAPVQVTFGADNLPAGSGNKYDPEKAFFVTSVAKDSGRTQMALLSLDRPVPAEVAKPVTQVDKGKDGFDLNTSGTFYGWSKEAGKPRMTSKGATLNEAYIVNDKAANPRKKPLLWVNYKNTSFNGTETGSDAGMGVIEWPDVRKGFGVTGMLFHPSDDGAPFINSAGELVGLYVGGGVTLDMGQERVKEFLSTELPQYDSWNGQLGKNATAEDALTKVQDYICAVDKIASSISDNANNLIQGIVVDAKSTLQNPVDKKETLKTARVDPDTEIYLRDSKTESCKSAAAGSPPTVYEGVPLTFGQARHIADKAKEDIRAAAEKLSKEKNKIAAKRQVAADNLKLYQEAVDFFKRQANGGFSPDAFDKQAGDMGFDQAVGKLPLKLRQGYVVTPKKVDDSGSAITTVNGTPETILEGITATTSGPSGSDIMEKLNKALLTAALNQQNAQESFAANDKSLNTANDKLANANKLKQYADATYAAINATADKADELAGKVQDDWRNKVLAKNQAYKADFTKWVSDYKRLETAKKNADQALDTLDGKIQAAQSTLTQNSCPNETPGTKELCIRTAQEKSALVAQRPSLEQAKNKALEDFNAVSAKPEPTEEKYQPEHPAAEIAEAANQMPQLMLAAQHLALIMKDIKEGFEPRPFAYQPEIDAAKETIKTYLEDADKANDNIRWNARDINKIYADMQKLVAAAPPALRPKMKLYENSILKNSQIMSEVQVAAQQAVKTLENLLEQAKVSPTTEKSNQYVQEAGIARRQADDSLKSAEKELQDAEDYLKAAQAEAEGKPAVDPTKPGGTDKPMTDKEKAEADKKAAEEKQKAEAEKQKAEAAKKKAEAEKKAAEAKKKAEAAKKKAEADKKAAEEKQKAEAEAKKKEADEKKEAERLAKALSINTMRAAGDNRVLTSIAAWKRSNKFTGDSVLIVDGRKAADGLSAAPLAAALKSPILLTMWETGLEPPIIDQLKAATPQIKHVILVGGKVHVSPNDEFQLNEAGIDVRRIAGPDRFTTGVAVNQEAEKALGAGPNKPLELYIGDGIGYADALAAGSAAGRNRGLMMLSKGNTIEPSVRNYMVQLGSTRPLTVIPVGGPAARAVQNTPWPANMSVRTKPIIGSDRYATAAMLASELAATSGVVLASGETFADALPGGALAAVENSALILTKAQELPQPTYEALRRQGSDKTIVMGGEKAVSRKVAELINGAKVDDINTVEGTLAERVALNKKKEQEKAEAQAKAAKDGMDMLKKQLQDSVKKDGAKGLSDFLRGLGLALPNDLLNVAQGNQGNRGNRGTVNPNQAGSELPGRDTETNPAGSSTSAEETNTDEVTSE